MIWVFNISAWKIHRKNKVKVFFWCSSSRTAAVCIRPEQDITEDVRAFGVKEQFWCLRGRTCLRFCLPRAEFLPSPQPRLTDQEDFHPSRTMCAALQLHWLQDEVKQRTRRAPLVIVMLEELQYFLYLLPFFFPHCFYSEQAQGPGRQAQGEVAPLVPCSSLQQLHPCASTAWTQHIVHEGSTHLSLRHRDATGQMNLLWSDCTPSSGSPLALKC